MGRGLALPALLGALALLASCAQEEDASPTPIATEASSSPTPTATSATPTPALDQHGCETGPDGDKCRLLATYTPLPTATVAPPDAYYPRDTRTGVPEVDGIIDAVLSKDAAGLAELVSFLTYECHTPARTQPDAFVCREGQEPGDSLVGIWAVEVEGGLIPPEADGDREKLVPIFAQMFADEEFSPSPRELHAVFALDGDEPEAQYLRPDYIVTFVRWHSQAGPLYDSFQIRDGGLIAIEFSNPLLTSVWNSPDDPGWLLARAR